MLHTCRREKPSNRQIKMLKEKFNDWKETAGSKTVQIIMMKNKMMMFLLMVVVVLITAKKKLAMLSVQ